MPRRTTRAAAARIEDMTLDQYLVSRERVLVHQISAIKGELGRTEEKLREVRNAQSHIARDE